MKKIYIAIIGLLMLFVTGPVMAASMTGAQCRAAASNKIFIPKGSGEVDFTECYQAQCINGTITLRPMLAGQRYTCGNGNTDPYVRTVSDGCRGSEFSGSCNTANVPYCTRTLKIDCSKKSNGSIFEKTTGSKTTTKSTTKKSTKSQTRRTQGTKTLPSSTNTPTTVEPSTELPTEPPPSNNNNIISIKIGGSTVIQHKPENETYEIQIPYGMTELNVEVELEDPTARYEVEGNTNMPDDPTQIIIRAYAQDGSERIVVINVGRKDIEPNDCYLTNIFIADYPLDNFSRTNYKYTLTLPKKVTSLKIEAIQSNDKQEVVIKGNEKLKNKSVIEIDVYSSDKTKCQYTIQIVKKSNTWRYFILILILIVALAIAIYFLNGFLTKSKGKYKYE